MRRVSFRPPLIGRQDDLQFLKSRLERPGLTIVAAEPMMGKSYLLTHIKEHVQQLGEYSIGSAQGSAHNSLFKDAFQNLYSQALTELSKKQQGQQLLNTLKKNWPQAILKSLPGINKLMDHQSRGFEDLGSTLINGLLGVQKEFNSQIVKVDYEKAKQLATYIYQINNKPQVLILDALDQLAAPAEQGKLIETCAHDIFRGNDWPPIHIYVCLRSPSDESSPSEQAALQWAQSAKNHASTKLHTLNTWQPSGREWKELANYLNDNIPNFQSIAGESENYPTWLSLPGMIENILIEQPTTQDQLESTCNDCVQRVYQQLNSAITELSTCNSELFSLAAKISMLPELEELQWTQLKTAFIGSGTNIDSGLKNLAINLEKLRHAKILKQDIPAPSFGHTTRYQYMRDFCAKQWPSQWQFITEELAITLFSAIIKLDGSSGGFIDAILGLKDASTDNNSYVNIIIGLTSTFDGVSYTPNIEMVQHFRENHQSVCATPLAMGLINSLIDTKEENNSGLRDSLLDELRTLASTQPDNSELQRLLATGLNCSLIYAKEENQLKLRDSLQNELRTFAAAQPGNPEVQTQLAMGLYNSLSYAKEENKLALRDSLLDELRTFASGQPDNPEVQTRLAKGLFNSLVYAKEENQLELQDSLLEELRMLARAQPDNPEVQTNLAMGLYNSLIYAKEENKLALRDNLLDELRTLANLQPENLEVQTQLVKGLYNSLNAAKKQNKLELRDSLLDELRTLASTQPGNPELQTLLAKGLFNSLIDAKEEKKLELRDNLLDELRTLASSQPENLEVQTQLVKGLFNSLIDAKAENKLDVRNSLLDELRTLADTQPNNPEVQELQVMGLFNTYSDLKSEENYYRRDMIASELLALYNANQEMPFFEEDLLPRLKEEGLID